MQREFSIRVSGELADWVRRQGSPQDVIEMLAVQAARGRLRVIVPDPGSGPERLTVRFPVSGLRKLRAVTSSRQNIAALRKLIAAGCSSAVLPAPRPIARLEPCPARLEAPVVRRELLAISPAELTDLSPLRRRELMGFAPIARGVPVRPAANPGARRSNPHVREILRLLFWPMVR